MAEIEYSTTAPLRVGPIWEFVKDLDNWAPFVMGYQSHEKKSERESLWTLKADIGALQRVVTFRARVTEWVEPERVEFELEGVNEPVVGNGCFVVRADTGERDSPTAPRKSLFARLAEALLRVFHRLRRGGEHLVQASPGETHARLTFVLRLEPGGPMAPMINALMQPAMAIAAEDLAKRILAHVAAAQRS